MNEEFPQSHLEQPDETPIMMLPVMDQDEVKKKKRKEFWFGVGLWFLLNILVMPLIGAVIVFVMSAVSEATNYNSTLESVFSLVYLILGFMPFVINIGLMIYFAIKRPQLALGMLAGFGIALAIVVCLGVLFMAACFIWPPRF